MKSGLKSRNVGGRKGQKGNAIVEFAMALPVLAVLMLAIFDAGFYVAAFISVQNAARSAALRNSGGSESASDQNSACSVVFDQLRGFPGIVNNGCSSSPLVVTSVYCAAQAACGSSASTADGRAAALVTVRYTPPSMFRMALRGPATIAASSQMKLRTFE